MLRLADQPCERKREIKNSKDGKAETKSGTLLSWRMSTYTKKKVDARVKTLIENGIQLHERSLIVLVGDRGRDQVEPPPFPP